MVQLFSLTMLFSFLSAAESTAEVPGLQSMLLHDDDIRVSLQHVHWGWSEVDPFPPLEAVLQSPFWSDPKYADIREQLRRPAPCIEVTVGNDYITVDTAAESQAALDKLLSSQVKPGQNAAHLRNVLDPKWLLCLRRQA